jgi:two-component system sensor histidine kinase MprB
LRAQARIGLRVAGNQDRPSRLGIPAPGAREGGPGGYVQAVLPDGSTEPFGAPPELSLPATASDQAIAAGLRGPVMQDRRVAGVHVRVLTVPMAGGALQVARPLWSVDNVLASLRGILVMLVAGGALLAAVLTRLTARRVVAPIAELTAAAGHIEATGDLARRLTVAGDDEVGLMARRFNAMLETLARTNAALATSLERQRRLVADASHELRTPVTSLRTNLEVLREGSANLPERDRAALVADASAQAEELGVLVADLMELARDGDAATAAHAEDVRLDEIVEEALERARRHHPRATFDAELRPTLVHAAPERLGRAVNNLLDNAATHGGGTVSVRVADGELRVRDRGPGIPAGERTRVFDRFWRGSGARERAGSGLGLAIVAQVAAAAGGSAEARPGPGGGAEIALRLPVLAQIEPGADDRLGVDPVMSVQVADVP